MIKNITIKELPEDTLFLKINDHLFRLIELDNFQFVTQPLKDIILNHYKKENVIHHHLQEISINEDSNIHFLFSFRKILYLYANKSIMKLTYKSNQILQFTEDNEESTIINLFVN